MPTQDHLTRELEALGQQFGRDIEQRVRRVFTAIVRWLRRDGHGEVIASAIDHKFNSKVQFKSWVDVDHSGP